MLADSAIPISPTYVAASYPLCKPFATGGELCNVSCDEPKRGYAKSKRKNFLKPFVGKKSRRHNRLIQSHNPTCFLTFLEMLSAVWLISDFTSTPFALKLQLEILPLSPLATYVWLMIMSRIKSCSPSLHAPSDGFTPQEVRTFLISQTGQDVSAFLHQENNRLLFLFINLFTLWTGEQSYFLTESPFFL